MSDCIYDGNHTHDLLWRLCGISVFSGIWFTGKACDFESGDDYCDARYYARAMGRMLPPNPAGLFFADRSNPQSLNLYAYVRNDPLSFTDPTGLYCAWEDGTSDDDPKDGGATKNQCRQQGGHWTDASNSGYGMDNCIATVAWNSPRRDKTLSFDPRLESWPCRRGRRITYSAKRF